MEGISHDLAEERLLREQGSDAYGTIGSLSREEALGRAVYTGQETFSRASLTKTRWRLGVLQALGVRHGSVA
eukprot:9362322-Pyramimonas_sp.AAC.1